MKSAAKILILIIINIIVSVLATLATLYWWENIRQQEIPFSVNDLLSTGGIAATISPTQNETFPPVIDPDPSDSVIALPTEAVEAVALADLLSAHTPTPEAFIPATRDRLVSIVLVVGMGDLNSETIRIQSNADEVVTLEGWTIEDADKHTFTFPNIQLIQKGVFIELYTRGGHTTPFELYWDQPEARWQSGETVVLRDQTGQIQATYRIP